MLNIDWSKLIEQLKDVTGFRFYFLVTAALLLILTFIFKDEISIRVKNADFKRVEFKEVRDLKGLEVNLSTIKDSTMSDYIVYIYQPKQKSYYKRVLTTSSDLVKSIMRLQGSYIEDQITINNAFKDSNYILLSKDKLTPDTEYLHELGMNYILVYRLGGSIQPIGEIHMVFILKPTQEKIDETIKKLAPLIHMYIN